MERRVSTQDLTWFLDLNRIEQLNLDPPYQRRSVWTPNDRRFFLDTIFRNYPSPAIFLHKDIAENGATTYHVVDGKQRLQTILLFVNNKIRIAQNFGDERLNNKRWKDLEKQNDLKHSFWNYQITVEVIDIRGGELVNAVFDRLNRNSRKLMPQELRHAKYDGWFITAVETETEADLWRNIGLTSRARSKRMTDVQFMSELFGIILRKEIHGFDHEYIENLYADYDDIDDNAAFSEEDFLTEFNRVKDTIAKIEAKNKSISNWAKGFGNLYSIWGAVSLIQNLPDIDTLSVRFDEFMKRVDELGKLQPGAKIPEGNAYQIAAKYREASRGASTEGPQRTARHEALRIALLQQ
ncbi:DUF262 domain-containing protein [Mesorhizobium sp. 1M-11]|uniref:DUF262 domain-containing protein n=1 Tax=Mesorhizobium sp. 1M-11 TaxID=1529006 RepID=UPI0006C76BE9|nr:DUF262 domain-containing protein [Mesorhizobium sp. 1M-11]